jgi:hypothetical protein
MDSLFGAFLCLGYCLYIISESFAIFSFSLRVSFASIARLEHRLQGHHLLRLKAQIALLYLWKCFRHVIQHSWISALPVTFFPRALIWTRYWTSRSSFKSFNCYRDSHLLWLNGFYSTLFRLELQSHWETSFFDFWYHLAHTGSSSLWSWIFNPSKQFRYKRTPSRFRISNF